MAKIWFGNELSARYVVAPKSGLDAPGVGYSDVVQLNNGGAFVNQSSATHREFDMSWAAATTRELSFLNNYYAGLNGPGYLYWVDPFADNALPPHWSAPMLTLGDWPSIVSPSVRPSPVDSPPNSYGLPYRGAQFFPTGLIHNEPSRSTTLLIPRDKALHIGFTGYQNGATVRVRPQFLDGTWDEGVDLDIIRPEYAEQTNATFSGAQYRLVKLFVTPTEVGGQCTIIAGRAVYTGITSFAPLASEFIMGTGHTGLRFKEAPTLAYLQSARNRNMVTAAASFVEVEAWL